MTIDPFIIRLAIAVLVYFFFDIVIKTFVTRPDPQRLFEIILVIACLLYILFGAFLPFAK